MVSTVNEDRKRQRALDLAAQYPASREMLEFYAGLAGYDADWMTLKARLLEIAPASMSEQCALGLQPGSVFERILQRRNPPPAKATHSNQCPQCANPPQCAALRPEGEGRALFLVCSLCSHEWPFGRAQCPACLMRDEKSLSFYQAEQFPHIQTLLCEQCHFYLHVIDCAANPNAIPEVDELACTPLDIWARQQGYSKIVLNLAGV